MAELKPYKDVDYLKYWCQTVLPSVYDDSLSYYELLNKVVAYLNDLNNNVKTAEENVASVASGFQALQDLVATYDERITANTTAIATINATLVDLQGDVANAVAAADGAKNAATAANANSERAQIAANQALNVSKAANDTANQAKATADGIDAKATAAVDTANAAKDTAENAATTANSIAGTAQDAKTIAQAASVTAGEAKTTADGIDAKATAAVDTANTANVTAESANQTAKKAETTANGIADKAAKALTVAGNAERAANRALVSAAQALDEIAQIPESGSTAGWNWCKFNSGVAICSRVITTVNTPINTPWGNLWESDEFGPANYPTGLFIAPPTVSINGYGVQASICGVETGNAGTASTTPTWHFLRPIATPAPHDYSVHIIAFGRWKA